MAVPKQGRGPVKRRKKEKPSMRIGPIVAHMKRGERKESLHEISKGKERERTVSFLSQKRYLFERGGKGDFSIIPKERGGGSPLSLLPILGGEERGRPKKKKEGKSKPFIVGHLADLSKGGRGRDGTSSKPS